MLQTPKTKDNKRRGKIPLLFLSPFAIRHRSPRGTVRLPPSRRAGNAPVKTRVCEVREGGARRLVQIVAATLPTLPVVVHPTLRLFCDNLPICLYIATATSKEYTFFSNNFPQDRSQRDNKQGQTGHKVLAFFMSPKRRGTSIAAAGTSTEFAPGRATAARHNYIL